jgi:dTDP-4-dehydrorhamnose reductase
MDKTNIRVLILGHNGMLGHVVYNFLKQQKIKVRTIEHRWPSDNFVNEIINSKDDFIINCIGSIPQKENKNTDFISNNFLLPVFLSNFFKNKIIHASSDCENYNENIDDLYIKSKIKAYEYLSFNKNIKIIKTSIIGPEIKSKKSLWEWISNNKNKQIFGYTNHLWNGITTLQWAKIALMIIQNDIKNNIVNIGSASISKFQLLNILNKKLNLNKNIIPQNSNRSIDRFIYTDFIVDDIEKQIDDMIIWYKKI